MITYAPDYYPLFHCIADRCRHSCCIGWEIDIDDETHAYYRKVGGALGERLKSNIHVSEEGASFRLDKEERCPFLNEHGLCDLIIELGEDSLCEICAEHPRFRNFFVHRTEIGLGLCCEEAARLILTHQPRTTIISLNDDTVAECDESVPECMETDFFAFRAEVMEILQDRSRPIVERMAQTLALVGISSEVIFSSNADWAQFYLDLERLDPSWGDRLIAWQAQPTPNALPEMPELEIAFEQLAVYFVYRHSADSLDDGRDIARIAFAVLSCYVIRTLAAIQASEQGEISVYDLIEIARCYSAEIEYSTENVQALLDKLENYI